MVRTQIVNDDDVGHGKVDAKLAARHARPDVRLHLRAEFDLPAKFVHRAIVDEDEMRVVPVEGEVRLVVAVRVSVCDNAAPCDGSFERTGGGVGE